VKLELELQSDHVQPGGEVAGHVNVVEGGASRSLTLTLSFYEKTRDYFVTAYSTGFVVHEGEVTAGESYEFSFTLPAEAPTSAKTRNGELYWELEVKSDEHGLDSHARRRLEVG
jgi:hypothetical protein